MSIRESNALRVLQNSDTVAGRVRNTQLALINKEFSSNPSYREVLRNGTETIGVIITDNSSNATAKVDNVRSIIMKPDDILNIGDVFDYNEQKWICTSAEMFSDIYYRGTITQTNNTLTFYKNHILKTLPCIVQTGSVNYLGLDENKFLSTPKGRYIVICPDLGCITKADLYMRFILNNSAYKVAGIDNLSNAGLVIMELQDDEITADDRIDLGIANWYSNQTSPTPSTEGLTVSLTPSDTTLIIGRTLELTAHAYNDGVEDFTKYYLFTVTNDDGTTNDYISEISVSNTCTLTANKFSSYAGKYINVRVEILGSPSINCTRKIKLVAL